MGIAVLFLLFAQQATFDVASVKPSAELAGPDYNNKIEYSRNGIRARNATMRRLLADAYGLQMNQVAGPAWLDREEFDLDAKTSAAVDRIAPLLQALLTERFALKTHRETRQGRVYELTIDKGGAKVKPLESGMTARRFADFLAVQLTIALPDDPGKPGRATESPAPVLDKTGLEGTYDFRANIRPEPGGDSFVMWQEILRDQFGLKLVSRKGDVEMLVVDAGNRMPSGN